MTTPDELRAELIPGIDRVLAMRAFGPTKAQRRALLGCKKSLSDDAFCAHVIANLPAESEGPQEDVT